MTDNATAMAIANLQHQTLAQWLVIGAIFVILLVLSIVARDHEHDR